MSAVIAGAASRIERQMAAGVEPVIREVVRAALGSAGLSLADIDMVITVASDTLDGMMVPIRAELAGALGKAYLNVPSSAGHALAAAAATIAAGDAEAVLVVGWGAASRLARSDGRANQFDPFFARPVGAAPRSVAALQNQMLTASGVVSQGEIDAFGSRMAELCWGGAAEPAAHGFCDGAAALVIRRSQGEGGLVIARHATSSRGQAPADGVLDPAGWVQEVATALSPAVAGRAGGIEVSGPTLCAELRGIAGACEAGVVASNANAANAVGGGAAAWFGPATGLAGLARVWAGPSRSAAEGDAHLFIDLAGPLGQHVTGLLIERRRAA